MQRDACYWCWVERKLPPGCPWWLWWTASTLMEPFRLDGIMFCLCWELPRLSQDLICDSNYHMKLLHWSVAEFAITSLGTPWAVVDEHLLPIHHLLQTIYSGRCLLQCFTATLHQSQMFVTRVAANLIWTFPLLGIIVPLTIYPIQNQHIEFWHCLSVSQNR
jgi:hypothetical protein